MCYHSYKRVIAHFLLKKIALPGGILMNAGSWIAIAIAIAVAIGLFDDRNKKNQNNSKKKKKKDDE